MVTDNEAKAAIKVLNDYCLEHSRCENCILKPVNYKPVVNECLLEHKPPVDVYKEMEDE